MLKHMALWIKNWISKSKGSIFPFVMRINFTVLNIRAPQVTQQKNANNEI